MKKGTDYNVLVDIPEGAHRCSDGRVYIVLEKRYYSDLHYNMDSRAWLGKAVSDTKMHPNATYKAMYPENMKSISHINLPTYVKRLGMYAMALAIGEQTGLYEDLTKNFGPRSANLIMDYAVYSILTKSNVAKDFETAMEDQMLFLDRVYSDSWINEQIDGTITDNQIQAFKIAWMKRFSKEEMSSVWICIDGSNDDCTVEIDEAEKGKAKSHKNIDIVSFLYAVTDTGTPILSQIYRGSRVDSQALKEMIAIISGYGLTVKGVILDRGFCDEGCINLLLKNHYDFVIMMKENTKGFHDLLDRHQNEIKMKWKYALGNGLFGTSDRVKLFKSSSLETNAAIIWDGKNGIDRISYLIDDIMQTMQDAEEAMVNGKKPKIPDKYKDFIKAESNGEGLRFVAMEDEIQAEIQAKGFYGLICSKQMTAKEANAVYDLRDCSEKQYSLMKTQLGNSVFRAHNMHRIAVRETIAFVASIIRHSLMKKCRETKPLIDTNVAIKELNLINMNLVGDNRYIVIHNQCKRQKEILQLLGITAEDLDHIAAYETDRFQNIPVFPIHSLRNKDASQSKNHTKKIKGIPSGSKAQPKKKDAPGTVPIAEQPPASSSNHNTSSNNIPKPADNAATENRDPSRSAESKDKEV